MSDGLLAEVIKAATLGGHQLLDVTEKDKGLPLPFRPTL